MASVLNILIGGAGFIGSNLAKFLMSNNENVFVVDDLSLGSLANIDFIPVENFSCCDASNQNSLSDVFSHIFDVYKDSSNIKVWHLAANSDILSGVMDSMVDVCRTFNTTVSILKVMEKFSITHLCFASSSAIYGDQGFKYIAEDCGNLNPRSAYGAMKLASEALISSAREKFLFNVSIFRFPNVVGYPSTHGILHDFKKKLLSSPNVLDVLGNGTQCKSYLHVGELVSAMIHIDSLDATYQRVKIFNIGPNDDGVSVSRIAEIFVEEYGGDVEIRYGTEDRGWVGDIPKFRYDITHIKNAGWTPKLSSEDAVRYAVKELLGKS